MDVAVKENRACTVGAVEGFAAEECETASKVYSGSRKCVVGAFEVAVFEETPSRSDERTEIQSAQKTAIAGEKFLSVATDSDLGLNDSVFASGSVKFRISRILKVSVAKFPKVMFSVVRALPSNSNMVKLPTAP